MSSIWETLAIGQVFVRWQLAFAEISRILFRALELSPKADRRAVVRSGRYFGELFQGRASVTRASFSGKQVVARQLRPGKLLTQVDNCSLSRSNRSYRPFPIKLMVPSN